jgi:glyoxylase-like metal-dependent hydrolase (beta-lactamase superfamily II)
VRVTTFTVGAFQENCYLVEDDDTRAAALVDPGSESAKLIAAIQSSGAQLQVIWLTHAHVDHLGAIGGVKARWNVPVYLHPLDRPLYRVADRQAELYGMEFDEAPAPDREFSDGQTLNLGDLTFEVMHAPGHSPGHVVIHGHGVAFVGDCLFAGSIGRTDLPASKGADLEKSLERITALPEDTVVYPGHGPATTIGEERETNPFLTGLARIPRG